MTPHPLITVGVTPPEAHARYGRLLDALESAYPIAFHAATEGAKPADAALVFVDTETEVPTANGPTLTLVRGADSTSEQGYGAIRFESSDRVPMQFRGRTLIDMSTRGRSLSSAAAASGTVLAHSADGPVWIARRADDHVAAAHPVEPTANEPIRNQLAAGRFMGLLPLVHFVHELLRPTSWDPPTSRACFVVDDPNVHWWSYGFLDYRQLARHADIHGYHLTAAAVPLDHWYVHRGTAEFLRDQPGISFAIHGNNHSRHELARVRDVGEATALAEQARRRSRRLENAGLVVAPVMIPPHGVSSIATIEGCFAAGFDGLCADWPYWWLTDPDDLSPLSGFRPLDRIRGLPVLPRQHIVASDLDDLVFRALLGQPLLLYAHHTDFKDGLDVLAARADHVRSLGVDSWLPLKRLARDVVASRIRGDTMLVDLYSRTSRIELPEKVSHVELSLPGVDSAGPLDVEVRDAAGSREGPLEHRIRVEGTAVTVTVSPPAGLVPEPQRLRTRAVLRRLLGETRDRVIAFPTMVRSG